MSDDDEPTARTAAPIVVNVTNGKRNYHDHSPHEQYSDSESNEENKENNYDDEDFEEEVVTARVSSRRGHKHRGKKRSLRVDMTSPEQRLASTQKKARKLAEEGKVDKSIHEWVRCLALSRIVYGDSHWRLAQSHVQLAQAYLNLKDYATQAEYHTDIAKTILKSNTVITAASEDVPSIYKLSFEVYFILGSAMTVTKKYGAAEKALGEAQRVLKLLTKQRQWDSRDIDDMELKLTHALAKLYWKQKKYAVASSKYDELMSLAEARYGPDHVKLVSLYQECGRISFLEWAIFEFSQISKGRHANHDKAIQMFQQAHSIATARYKEGNVALVDTALALARAYINTGQEEAESSAESYLEDCLRTCTTLPNMGPLHPKTLEVKDELAKLLIRTEDYEEALRKLESSIHPKCEVFGDYSDQVSSTYKLIASIHLARGHIEKALKTYRKCYDIESVLLGKNHQKTKDTERTIDILLASPGLSSKFVLRKEDELQKRPRFNAIVSRSKPTSY
ncbi:hypothetical protein ScPMuIL_003068 [Solemya velum]